MKSVKLVAFFIAVACTFISCKKGAEDDTQDCDENNTTSIVFSNTGTTPLRVELASSLTPQFKPINPVVVLDLAPGATVTKEVAADDYFNVWSRDCSTTCTMVTYYRKTYDKCNAYEEKRGI